MRENLYSIFFKLKIIELSLDSQIYLDIFSMFKVFTTTKNIFFLAQLFYDQFFLVSSFIITPVIILLILLILFLNMFYYSIWYYLINIFFDYSWLFGINKLTFWLKERLLKLKFNKSINLAYYQADNMLICCLILGILISYQICTFYNYNFLSYDNLVFSTNITFLKWISLPFDVIGFGLLVDHLSMLMLIVVLSISTVVHYYSIDYMATDPRLLTFSKYLSGFTLAMLFLVLSNNYALLFMGWEGVGIFSYLLIGFWYTRTLALKASLKAVIVNWIGDVALIIACGLILHFFGTLEFKKLQILLLYLIDYKIESWIVSFSFFEISLFSLITFFLLIAAVGKSAQFGLHTWLPDAMEGPTPVSALIHAATMVTAGVYLIVRSSFFFEFSEIVRNLTLIIGAFTALFGSITACFQFDIKRIIAFSTCSQLGYMFLACGLSAYNLAMFHLFIHAFFKALLFLCAGSVIHSIGDEQDIRWMGGFFYYLPITYAGLIIGFVSLIGLPFTSGFFSKDTIIELALTKRTIPALYGYTCGIFGIFFTMFYSFWFFIYVCFHHEYSYTRSPWTILSNLAEHGENIKTSLFILTIVTIFIGGLTKNLLTNPFSFIFFSDSIFIKDYNFYFNLYELFLHFYVKLHDYVFNYLKWFILIWILFAYSFVHLTGYWMHWYDFNDLMYDIGHANTYHTKNSESESTNIPTLEFYTDSWIIKFFETKGSNDQIYNYYIVSPLLNFAYTISYKELDWGWLEYFFVKIPTNICFSFAKIFNHNFGSLWLNFFPALIFLAVLVILLIILIVILA